MMEVWYIPGLLSEARHRISRMLLLVFSLEGPSGAFSLFIRRGDMMCFIYMVPGPSYDGEFHNKPGVTQTPIPPFRAGAGPNPKP
jgi:hypothetical protein